MATLLCRAVASRSAQGLLPPCVTAALHTSCPQGALAAGTAPPRMVEAAEAVREVMGQPAEPVAQAQQAQQAPVSPGALRFDDPRSAFKAKSTTDILRSLLVFQLCKLPALVRNADSLLAWSKRVFGSTLTNAVVYQTFYKQFVAGEDAAHIQPTLRKMKASGVRAILDYAAEDDVEQERGPASRQAPQNSVIARTYEYESERVCDSRMGVFLKSIEAAQSGEGQGFAAIKLSALGLPALLERTSDSLLAIKDLFGRFDTDGNGQLTKEEFAEVYSQLFVDDAPERIDTIFAHLDAGHDTTVDYVDWISQINVMDTAEIAGRCRSRGPFAEAALDAEETQLLRNMMGRLDRLAEAAAQADVRLLVDAEYTYFQPAIDNAVTELQRRYNGSIPRVYNTVQCYLRDSHSRLLTELERARRENYKYGAKLVRGAYMVLERQRAKQKGHPSPVHDTVEDTHANYDRCVREMLQCVAGEGAEVMVASHNQRSVEQAVAGMAALGLPPSAGVYFGQLLGMADHLTYTLGAHGYGAYKYVPFGAVDEVMPYLIRRAQENSTLLAGAAVGDEVAMMRRELLRRMGLSSGLAAARN